MRRTRRPPQCPIANPSCPIKNGAASPCTASGCSYGKGGAGTTVTNANYPIIFGAIGAIAVIAAAIGYFSCNDGKCGSNPKLAESPTPTPTINNGTNTSTPGTSPSPTSSKPQSIEESIKVSKSLDASIPDEDKKLLTMDGSATMVTLMKKLRNEYEQAYPNRPTSYGLDAFGAPQTGSDVRPSGSDAGLRNLIDGKILMAATSRPLKIEEVQREIVAVPIARDAVVIMVGKDNLFKGSLSKEQLRDIYLGKITNWSDVGGPKNLTIKVYNRSKASGTRSFFKDTVLLGAEFGYDGPNFTTWEPDETTAVVRKLGNDGIYYANISQAEQQKGEFVKIVSIDGINPEDKQTLLNGTYPLGRAVYLAAPKKTTPAVKQFIEFVLSPTGQRIVENAEFIRLP
jgi:phosphate transport system substrate-binding protein